MKTRQQFAAFTKDLLSLSFFLSLSLSLFLSLSLSLSLSPPFIARPVNLLFFLALLQLREQSFRYMEQLWDDDGPYCMPASSLPPSIKALR